MSREDVDFVRALIEPMVDANFVELFSTSEGLEAVRAMLSRNMAPDFETVTEPETIAVGGATIVDEAEGRAVSRGFEEFIAAWQDWLSAFADWRIRLAPDPYEDLGAGRVRVDMVVDSRTKTGGVPISYPGANVYTVRDGKVARLEMYFNPGESGDPEETR